jgi:hypothetical protein
MRPVSLGRIVKTARFAEMTRAFSSDELAIFLASSKERAKIIASVGVQIGLLERDGSIYYQTPACALFLQYVRADDWAGIHRAMIKPSNLDPK